MRVSRRGPGVSQVHTVAQQIELEAEAVKPFLLGHRVMSPFGEMSFYYGAGSGRTGVSWRSAPWS
jgi:hypothetical protein